MCVDILADRVKCVLISMLHAEAQELNSCLHAAGSGQASSVQEHASVVVETVTKTSTTTKFSGIQKFSSDASKCVAKGNGLTKAFRGKTSTFTVDTTGAGKDRGSLLLLPFHLWGSRS